MIFNPIIKFWLEIRLGLFFVTKLLKKAYRLANSFI